MLPLGSSAAVITSSNSWIVFNKDKQIFFILGGSLDDRKLKLILIIILEHDVGENSCTYLLMIFSPIVGAPCIYVHTENSYIDYYYYYSKMRHFKDLL